MTSPRSQLVDPTTPGYYHCMSRCVRRAWLCGIDAYTGESFEHRRQWVEDRIVELGRIFAHTPGHVWTPPVNELRTCALKRSGTRTEPPRLLRRLRGLSHAAMADSRC
jgi:hypothetical protein